MVDTKHTVNCPACGKEMKKIFVKDANINLDICLDGCGGIFFDNRELEKINNTDASEKILQLVQDMNFTKIDEEKPRICPICNIPMVQMGSGNANVKIDVCNLCGAKFLDNGELKATANNDSNTLSKNDTAKIIRNILK